VPGDHREGQFNGTVAVDNAEIHGRFEGEPPQAAGGARATGRVSGKIRYAHIKIEEGAELSGRNSRARPAGGPSSLARRTSSRKQSRQSGLHAHPMGMKPGGVSSAAIAILARTQG
jgi:cytoskeletal protein CcmA (bactofilin family)